MSKIELAGQTDNLVTPGVKILGFTSGSPTTVSQFDISDIINLRTAYNEVATFADLPTNAAIGTIYIVRTTTGTFLLNRKPAGFYIRRSTLWELLNYTSKLAFNLNNPLIFSPASMSDVVGNSSYYGGNAFQGWFINRFIINKDTTTRTRANVANNPTQITLTAAWANRSTLVYS